MGAFSLSLPGTQPQPISGDSLTQYWRSLSNQTGGAGGQLLQSGLGQVGVGQGSLGTAMGTTGTALDTTQPAVDYWKAILSGDPAALTKATAPTANALSQLFAGANSMESTNAPAGGARSATLAQLPQAQASQVGNYLLGLQPTAAQNLNTLAGTQNSIAGTQGGIGTAQGNLGLGVSGQGTNLLQSTLQSLLQKLGINQSADNANMGLLTSGLQSIIGGGQSAAGYATLSDVDAKTGIIPLGAVHGIPVYAWRYKGTGEIAMGVIAQEVRHIMPEAVVEGSDGLLRVNYDLLFSNLKVAA